MKPWKYSEREGYDLQDALQHCAIELQPTAYLEIGVDGGGSLNSVLAVCRPEVIVLCDIWDPKYCGHGLNNHSHVEPHLSWRGLLEKTWFLDGDSKVLIPEKCSEMVFDLICVDGDHSTEGASTDLKNCWPLLRSGGCMVADDIHHSFFPHLVGVLESFLKEHPDAIVVPEEKDIPRNCVVIQKI